MPKRSRTAFTATMFFAFTSASADFGVVTLFRISFCAPVFGSRTAEPSFFVSSTFTSASDAGVTRMLLSRNVAAPASPPKSRELAFVEVVHDDAGRRRPLREDAERVLADVEFNISQSKIAISPLPAHAELLFSGALRKRSRKSVHFTPCPRAPVVACFLLPGIELTRWRPIVCAPYLSSTPSAPVVPRTPPRTTKPSDWLINLIVSDGKYSRTRPIGPPV